LVIGNWENSHIDKTAVETAPTQTMSASADSIKNIILTQYVSVSGNVIALWESNCRDCGSSQLTDARAAEQLAF